MFLTVDLTVVRDLSSSVEPFIEEGTDFDTTYDFLHLQLQKKVMEHTVVDTGIIEAYVEDLEVVDYLMADVVRKAIVHSKEVCEKNKTINLIEQVGHFVTSLRRYINYEISNCGCGVKLGRYDRSEILRLIQYRICDTNVWKDIGIVNPKNRIVDTYYAIGGPKNGEFRMSNERVQNWAYLSQDEEQALYREIDQSIQRMEESLSSMDHHTYVMRNVNSEGERVINDFKETVTSVYEK